MTSDQYPMFTRLVPKTSFKGGRIADTDLLDLNDAAEFASVHAGKKITPKDFLRAAGRGEILLRALVHQTKRVQRVGGGDYFKGNQDTNGSIQNLPLSACKQLAAVGKAHWREIDGFKTINGISMRYTVAELDSDQSDFETVTADCMVTGDAVNALADAYIDEPAPAQTATPAPVVAVEPANDGPAPLNTIIHSTKTRRDALTPVIELAQSLCRDSTDTAEVWAALLVLAEKKTAPLIGATEEGLQYLKGGTAEIFTRKSLGKRLTR